MSDTDPTATIRTAADAAARFSGEAAGNVYSRYTNPTVRAFEERIAALEGAEQAVATATGMAAILSVVMSLCSAGDHILVSRSVFGSTISLFEKYFKRFGIEVDYVPLADLSGWNAAIKANTKAIRFDLGQRVHLQLRKIPELTFYIDDSLDYIEKIDNLLKK